MLKINFSRNPITQKDMSLVSKILKSGWLTHGLYSQKFENEFSKFTNSKYSTLVSNCTAGLHLACKALGFKKGDEVIVPSQTHVATAHAVSYTGATPVFADINLYSGNISSSEIKRLINKKTKGIIIVHFAGYPCDMKKIVDICRKNNLKLIEDCAHALGTKYDNKHVGNFGDVGVFSFYPTKQISTGEGGIIITNSKSIFNNIKNNKAFGIDTDIKKRKIPGLYNVRSLGLNFRMTDFQAALGYNQLKKYKTELSTRRKNAKIYCEMLKNIPNINFHPYDSNASYFIFPIFIQKNIRLKLINHFKIKNVGFSIHYARPVDFMKYYKLNKCLNSKKFSDETISLPVHSEIDKRKISYIVNIIKEVIKKNK